LQAAIAALPVTAACTARTDEAFAPRPGSWRRFEVVTRVAPPNAGAPAQAWIPLPSATYPDWFRPLGETVGGGGAPQETAADGARMLHASWAAGQPAEPLTVTVRFATRDRAIVPSPPRPAPSLSPAERARHLSGSELAPVDGLVKQTAERITAGARGDRDRALAIYEWVAANTYRDPAAKGCGKGDVAAMLRSGKLGGKCADINRLFVALLRASGVPARELYGVRVGPSRFGYRSLGENSEDISHAQHCRAEAWLAGHG
jgi:transglutaminase-like putative cysteine protease